MKKIVFITGTRADYGKLKSLMLKVQQHSNFELHIFVTGMHLLSKYGETYKEIEKDKFNNIYKYINQKINQSMDITLSNTILGFSNYVAEIMPDLIVVHGDRVEALAGAIVGAFNNVKVAHIEGGEVSGTIDESIRHAITKFAHIHLVANEEAKQRVIQLGEQESSVFVIGSPDIDLMYSEKLPTLEEVKKRYEINFDTYNILMYHPVTTEIDKLRNNVQQVVDAIIYSNKKYVVIYPNNDEGSNIILEEYARFNNNPNIKVFPSLRFEYFLTLLKHCQFIIGNSSAGIREASVYGIPSIDIGTRQQGRYIKEDSKNIVHVDDNFDEILDSINYINTLSAVQYSLFGNGKSADKFIDILESGAIWELDYQKQFINFKPLLF